MSTEDRGEAPHVGQLVRRDREAAGLSRAQLASRVGCSHPHIKNIENGHRPITPAMATALGHALGAHPSRYRTTPPEEVTNP